MSNRDRIDEMRRLLVDAFMTENTALYSQAVLELEKLIGVSAGRPLRNDTRTHRQQAMSTAHMRQFRWGNKKLDAERHADGTLTYSIGYGPDKDDDDGD